MTGWLPDGATDWGGRPIARSAGEASGRQRAALSGTVRCVRVREVVVPAVEALLQDGSGTIALCWLGRREVPGITEGAMVTIEGTVVDRRGHLTILNPLYRFAAGAP